MNFVDKGRNNRVTLFDCFKHVYRAMYISVRKSHSIIVALSEDSTVCVRTTDTLAHERVSAYHSSFTYSEVKSRSWRHHSCCTYSEVKNLVGTIMEMRTIETESESSDLEIENDETIEEDIYGV